MRIGLGVSNELLKSMEGRKSSTPPGRFWKPVTVEASGFRTNWNCRPSLRAGVSVMTFRLRTRAEIEKIFPVISSSFPCYEPNLNCSIRCGHVLLTTEKVRALVDNIKGKKDRDIEGEVVKKDDDDG